MISLNHFMAFIVISIVRDSLHIPTFQEEIASHCLVLGMDWFVLDHLYIVLGFPCEFWWFTYNLGLIRKILSYCLSIQDLPECCFHLLLRGKTGIPIGFLIWKMKHFLRWCVFHLFVWNALAWLVASSALLVLQGQDPAGSFKLQLPWNAFLIPTYDFSLQRNKDSWPHVLYSVAGFRPEFGSYPAAFWLCDPGKKYLSSLSPSFLIKTRNNTNTNINTNTNSNTTNNTW